VRVLRIARECLLERLKGAVQTPPRFAVAARPLDCVGSVEAQRFFVHGAQLGLVLVASQPGFFASELLPPVFEIAAQARPTVLAIDPGGVWLGRDTR
jgi:hypothetical protein